MFLLKRNNYLNNLLIDFLLVILHEHIKWEANDLMWNYLNCKYAYCTESFQFLFTSDEETYSKHLGHETSLEHVSKAHCLHGPAWDLHPINFSWSSLIFSGHSVSCFLPTFEKKTISRVSSILRWMSDLMIGREMGCWRNVLCHFPWCSASLYFISCSICGKTTARDSMIFISQQWLS